MSPKRLALASLAAALVSACGGGGTDGPTPTSIAVTPSSPLSLSSVGQTQQLTPAVKDANGAAISGFSFTYNSTASTVASVSTGGLVTAVANGSATIVIAATGTSLSTNYTVNVAQAAAGIAKTGGDAQSGTAGTQLATPIKVKVTDALAHAVTGVIVTFAAQNGGSVSASADTTDANGEASVTWTLGAGTGAQTATAAVTGLSPVTFNATATSASALTITKFVGDAQTALVTYPTNVRPAVRITNALAQPQAGISVTFHVASGGGSVSASGDTTMVTDANGVAQVKYWKVGASAGANSLTATGAGSYSGSNNVTFTATAQTAQYAMTIVNNGPALRSEVQSAFDSAVAFWQRAIYGDLAPVATGGVIANACGTTYDIPDMTIDDILIIAQFDSIDGPGNTLGHGGACYVRNTNVLPVVGVMVFDSADMQTLISDGSLRNVMIHEMGHVLGFSTGIWNATGNTTSRTCAANVPRDSVTGEGTAGLDSYFQCTQARAAFDSVGGGSFTGGTKVPLENCTGLGGTPCSLTGTIYSHWRETSFGNELMTGYIDAGANPVSIVTLGSYADIGYLVNFGAAQTYTHTFTAPAFVSRPPRYLGDDVLRMPIRVLDPSGRVVRVIRQ